MDCAVLFADVAGSTALYEVLGDERAFALVEGCLAIMSACTAQERGRVVKTIGDAVLSVFPSAADAAAAAIAMQTQVQAHGPGQGVRLCDLASRGQIVTDRDTARSLVERFGGSLRTLYAIPVKGKAEEVDLIELNWQPAGDEKTLIAAARPAHGATKALLELNLGGQALVMGPDRRKVTVGRDLEADFVVRDRNVSRAHAMIERRREHFVLADHSANGCFVTFEGRPEIRVHHEELTLVGHGWITFGQPRVEALQVAEFRCVEAPGAGAAPA